MNIDQHIDYWRRGSDEDWEMAEIALEKGKIRHGLFFLHLAMEKLVKAHVCRVTRDQPPRIHNLVLLMQRANLPFDQKLGEFLTELNSFCLEGRYANEWESPPSRQKANKMVQQAQEMRTWLLNLL